MFNSTCPLFHPLSFPFINPINISLVNHFFPSIFLFYPFPSHSFVLSFICFSFPLCTSPISMSVFPPRCSPHHPSTIPASQREQRKSLRELKMWLDQLERDAIQAQETEGNLAQQYQVSVCVCVRVSGCVCSLNWAHWAQTLLLLA